ncbi:MAG: hypothetical protein RLZZ91_1013 [Bacteroidota bacterium]|jgi:hypothetical protein
MAEGSNYRDDVFSREVRAGKRKYFFDVKTTRGNDLFMTITESKRSGFSDSGQASYEKHKIFLYKEDFDKFIEGLEDTINHIRQLQDTGDFRSSEFETSENENSESIREQIAPAAESSSEEPTSSSSDISFDDL